MKIDDLGTLLGNLKEALEKYKTKCIWRIQIDEGQNKEEPEQRCLNCNGYSSRIQCIYYTDIQHLIRFYESFKRNDTSKKDEHGFYRW
jgi:hypothetical protein